MTGMIVNRSLFWWINELGILLEIIGALVIVISAFRTRSKIRDLPNSFEGDLATTLRDTIANQAFRELFGFGLLACGLFMQMIGGVERL